jgi:hypothetical protein
MNTKKTLRLGVAGSFQIGGKSDYHAIGSNT